MQSKTKPEFVLQAFLKLFKNELVDAAYEGILGRPADPEGRVAHADALVRTGNLAEILRLLSHCDELAVQLPHAKVLEIRKSAIRTYYRALPHVATANKKILLLGNCQVRPLSQLMQAMLADADIAAIELMPEAVKRLEEMAAEGNPAIQMMLPMAEMVGWLRKGVGELMRNAGLQMIQLLMEEEVKLLAGERSQPQAGRTANRWGRSAATAW